MATKKVSTVKRVKVPVSSVKKVQKRVSKKEFYASNGVEYDPKTQKILSPWGEWVREPLTYGTKTHCMGWSTLGGNIEWEVEFNGSPCTMTGTCNRLCPDCYACNGRYKMPSNKNANAWRTFAARYHQDWLKNTIICQINWGKRGKALSLIRVHISGDFFSTEYIQMWIEIEEACLDTRFWAYTKNEEAEISFDALERFNIIRSLIPSVGMNYGKCAHIIEAYEKLTAMGIKTHICRCAIDKEQHCDNCKACSELMYVLFLLHGDRNYNPEEDPDYERLVALIESQPSMIV